MIETGGVMFRLKHLVKQIKQAKINRIYIVKVTKIE